MLSNLLTISRLSTLRNCPRKHFYSYELGLRRIRSAEALRFGGAFHVGLEAFKTGSNQVSAITKAVAGYSQIPIWANPNEWELERLQLENLLAGHFWRYSEDAVEYVEVEKTFYVPIFNYETESEDPDFEHAGKIDGIVRLPDGRLAVLEYKTTSEDIGPDSSYWLRLRCDAQISAYVLGARALGFNVETVLYDVSRKPTINPAALTQEKTRDFINSHQYFGRDFSVCVTECEDPENEGDRVYGFTVDGVSAEIEWGKKGFAIRETPDMYAARLLSDIESRPDHYYARREIPRLEDELALFQTELYQQAEQLRESQKSNRWFRNVSRSTCGYCEYADICLGSVNVNPQSPPAGFEIVTNAHPELTEGDSTL